MVYSIGCDMHKRYSVFAALDAAGVMSKPVRVAHEADRLRKYFAQVPPGTPVAFETTGHWHWFADLLEDVGMAPKLTHARKAKVMMGHTNKTDPLDAQGLATLLHTGTLPEVWIPPRAVRDQRELLRWDRRDDPLAELPASVASHTLTRHIVLVGYGRVGRHIAEALDAEGMPYVVAEQQREAVETLRRRGLHAVVGDATEPAVLIQAHVARAQMLVIATPDSFRARKMIEIARTLNPHIAIVVR